MNDLQDAPTRRQLVLTLAIMAAVLAAAQLLML
jgi:hypothetical protein